MKIQHTQCIKYASVTRLKNNAISIHIHFNRKWPQIIQECKESSTMYDHETLRFQFAWEDDFKTEDEHISIIGFPKEHQYFYEIEKEQMSLYAFAYDDLDDVEIIEVETMLVEGDRELYER